MDIKGYSPTLKHLLLAAIFIVIFIFSPNVVYAGPAENINTGPDGTCKLYEYTGGRDVCLIFEQETDEPVVINADPVHPEENTESNAPADSGDGDTNTDLLDQSSNDLNSTAKPSSTSKVSGSVNYAQQENSDQTNHSKPTGTIASDQNQLSNPDNLIAQSKPVAKGTDSLLLGSNKGYVLYSIFAFLILGNLALWYLIKKRKFLKS